MLTDVVEPLDSMQHAHDFGFLLELWRDSTAPVRTPIYPVYGGHDGEEEMRIQGGDRDKYEYIEGISCVQNYQRVIGPFYYSFNWGGRHFIAFSKEDS